MDDVKRDYRRADLSDADRVLLGFVEKLTRDSGSVRREDLDALRDQGFDDRALLEINLVAAWANFINRIVHGLGVEIEETESPGE